MQLIDYLKYKVYSSNSTYQKLINYIGQFYSDY